MQVAGISRGFVRISDIESSKQGGRLNPAHHPDLSRTAIRYTAVAAQPHCAYLFANRCANRMKVLVHDGLGIWLVARRLHQGKFFCPGSRHGSQMELGAEQLHALVLGLPWQRVGPGSAISIV